VSLLLPLLLAGCAVRWSVVPVGTAEEEKNGQYCPVNKCTFVLLEPITQNFIAHFKTKHPFYRPINATLAKYVCYKCVSCGIVPTNHVCNAKIQTPVLATSVSYNMPGKTAYMQTVDISWTVTLSDIDITQSVYQIIKKEFLFLLTS
jgi:hypothetical protein